MATTTTVHAQLIRYATNGDQIIVNLKSAGSDISIDRSTNTKLPSTVSSAQTLADALGNLAFKNSLGKGDVGLGNVDNTADSAKSVKYATSAGSAGSATKATQDSAGQTINSTYIKSLTVSGRTITITKGDNTTSTITTQDTNTTYGVFAKATADAAGGTGLVPAPAKGQQGLYLRGDGSWATPTNTWRGVQDNLTSTATDQSLSANQGKVLKGLIDGKAASSHTHTASQITDSIPASKISGVLSLSNIPAGALERLIPVADDTARFKLTTANAQNGDVIKVTNTGKMYFVKDDTKLSTEAGYEVFVAGTAAAVAWTNVTGRPSSMPASDVSAWAKAASKPSYSKSEVGLGNVDNTADSTKSVKYATTAGSANAVAWANVSGKPTTFTPSAHTHNYAGSSSAGGAANSAVKLNTARSIGLSGDASGSVSFDGSGNVSIPATIRKCCFIGSDTASTAGCYKVASQTMSGYGDTNAAFVVTSTYDNWYMGIFALQVRSDNTYIRCPTAKWLVRTGFPSDAIRVVISGMTWTMYVNQKNPQYGRIMFEIISQSTINAKDAGITLFNSSTKESTEPKATVTSTDGGSVSWAASAGSVAWGNVSGRPSSMPASDVPAWAKASSKPSYSKSEVGLGNVDNTADSAKSVKYATTAGSANAVAWANVSGKPSSFTPASHSHDAASASANGFMSSTDKAKLDFGDIVYVSKSTPTKACIWVKLD